MATSLDTPIDTNVANVISALTAQGYTWDPLTEHFDGYLARALTGIGGTSVSRRSMSRVQLLAGLINALGSGPVSYLTTGMPDLLNLLGGAQQPPAGQQFLTVTDNNGAEQFVTVTDNNGVEQRITVATGLS